MCELKNTVRFAFGDGADKPAIGEAVAFVKGLNAAHDDIEAVYRMAEEKSLFVKFKQEQSLLHMLESNPQELIFRYANGKQVKVHMTHAQDRICYVRIYDLPPEVSDQEIVSVLAKFGQVKRVVREKIPEEYGLNAFSGVRGAYMDVKKEIPSALHFASRRGNIYYSGNKDKCHICKEEGHLMANCPQRKVRNQQKKRLQEKEQTGAPSESYTGAVSGGIATVDSEEPRSTTSQTTAGAVKKVKRDGNHQGGVKMDEEEGAAAATVAEISDEQKNSWAVWTQIGERINEELTKQLNKKKDEEQNKSPRRKKKNNSLYINYD